MCEFKIIKKNDESQIVEDIVVLSYTDDNELFFRDVIGAGESLPSAIILDVNTLNQTCTVYEHELIKPFMELLMRVDSEEMTLEDIESFQKRLETIKKRL